MPTEDHRVTLLLRELGKDDGSAAAQLLPLLYDELHALAELHFRRERMGHTLQPTALVHEAYMKLARQAPERWKNREHFLVLAAQSMQRVLRDYGRRRRAAKRGGSWGRVSLEGISGLEDGEQVDMVDLDEVLVELARHDERKAQVVTLRFFGGLTNEAVARQLGVSRKTVVQDWAFAKAWIGVQLKRRTT